MIGDVTGIFCLRHTYEAVFECLALQRIGRENCVLFDISPLKKGEIGLGGFAKVRFLGKVPPKMRS